MKCFRIATAIVCLLVACSPARAENVRVMIVAGQNNHDWRRSTPYLHWIIDHHPEISATIQNAPSSGDPELWENWNPDFDAFDVVVLNYNGQMWPDHVKQRFTDYIREGGSAMLIHAANNAFTGWTEFEEMVGLLWRGRDYGASVYLDEQGQQVRVAAGEGRNMGHGGIFDWVMTTQAEHPITQGMPPRWMHARDELYHGQRGPAEGLNVLLSAYSDPGHGGTGLHEPIVWWVPFGEGKVLTNVMGHVGDLQCMQCVGFQTITQRGCLWLAGRETMDPLPEAFPIVDRTSITRMTDELVRQMEDARIRRVSGSIQPRGGGVSGLASGLRRRVYEGQWDRLPKFDQLEPATINRTSTISAQGIDGRSDHYGIVLDGFLSIEEPGDYTFYTKSDDGSALLLGNTVVVINDGVHGEHEEGGRIRLEKGVYPLEIRFFEKDGGEALQLSYSGPGLPKQTLPVQLLYHTPFE